MEAPLAPSWFHRFFFGRPWRTHLLVTLLVLLGLHSYISYLMGHFSYDDHMLIVDNPAIRSFSEVFTVLASGRPIRGLTLMLDYQLFGLNARGYHFTNVLWHAATVFLFYALLHRLFRRPFVAGLGALLFALHPVHSEAVMGITHRKEILAFFFMTLAFHAWLYRPRRPIIATLATGVFFVLGMLSKQVVIVLPLVLLGYEYYFQKRRFNWRAAAGALPLLLIAGALLAAGVYISAPILRDFDLFGLIKPADLAELGYSKIIATSLSVIPLDLRTLLFPVHLHLDPQVPIVTFADPRAWLGLLMGAGLIAAAYFLRRQPDLGFGLFWIIVTILPVMNIFPSNAFFAERYLYIPSAGAGLFLAGLWDRLYHSTQPWFAPAGYRATGAAALWLLFALVLVAIPASRINAIWDPDQVYHADRTASLLVSVLACGLVAAIACLAWERRGRRLGGQWAWLDLVGYYAIVVMAGLGLAAMMELLLRHRLGLPRLEIEAGWMRTREWIFAHAVPGPRSDRSFLNPSFTARAEIGNLFFYSFGFPAVCLFIARRVRRTEALIHPNRGLVWEMLVLLVLALGTQKALRNSDWTSEVRLWQSTLIEAPTSINAWNNLGNAHIERHRFDLAAEAFAHAAELSPRDFRIWRNLGMTQARIGNYPAARDAFARAVELAPGDPMSAQSLANSCFELAAKNRDPAAMKQVIPLYLKVLELDPRSAHAHYNLALCYSFLNDLPAALREVRQALAIEPGAAKSLKLERMLVQQLKKPEQETKPPPEN